MIHSPGAHLTATLAVACGLAAFGGCTLGSDAASDQTSSRTEEKAATSDLHRSLELPALSGDDACPQSAASRPNPDVGVALGPGPAYPILGFEGEKKTVELTRDELQAGSYWHKTLWAIDPGYDGPVLIRARGLDPPGAIRLGYDEQALTELELPAKQTARWRYGTSFTILPGPGCFAFQVDGSDFSEVIVFEASESKMLLLEGKPQIGVLKLGPGRSSARFAVTALDPPTHTYDVRVRTEASADISVRMRTWYGQSLRVLESVGDELSCHVRGGRADCISAFPALEAQRPGPWTVIVNKQSGPPVTVRVAVTFNHV